MRIKTYCLSLVFLLLGTVIAHSQERHTEICIDFRVNETYIDPSLGDNASRMQEMITFLQDIRKDSTVRIVNVSFCGAASPEGSYQLNRKLAQGRLAAIEKLVRQEVEIPDSIITRMDSYIPWDYLKSRIEDSNLSHREEILAILNEKASLVDYHRLNTQIDSRILKLQQLDDGRAWKELNKIFFSGMRNACMLLVTYQKVPQPVQEPVVITEPVEPEPSVSEPQPEIEEAPDTPVIIPEPEDWIRQLHVKTNALGLGLAIANVAVEVDICKHLSFTLPVYYSAWDYFKPTIKFRTLGTQPEFRYWFHPDNEGWFLGAHFGIAYYNIAWNGDYRYHSHNRKTPAMGGGLAAGYRTHLSKNKRWKMEFSLGGGVYQLEYDKFHNTPVTKDGLMVESSVKKTYWGLDQAAISLSYTFNLKKKGGNR